MDNKATGKQKIKSSRKSLKERIETLEDIIFLNMKENLEKKGLLGNKDYGKPVVWKLNEPEKQQLLINLQNEIESLTTRVEEVASDNDRLTIQVQVLFKQLNTK